MYEPSHRREIKANAEKAKADAAYEQAGDWYTRTAYYSLSANAFDKWGFWQAIDELRYAAVCYRLADEEERCTNRSNQAILMIEDVLNGRLPERQVKHDGWAGLGYEYIGDFRMIADIEGADDAYDQALKLFERVEQHGEPSPVYAWAGEQGFETSTLFLFRLIDAVGWTLDSETYRDFRSLSLVRRIEYRKANLQELLSLVDDQGRFDWSDDAMAPPEGMDDLRE